MSLCTPYVHLLRGECQKPAGTARPHWLFAWFYLSQPTTKSTIRLVRPAKTQISLRIRVGWSESSLFAYVFYSLQVIKRGINESSCNTGWIYRLIWVFASYTCLINFVLRWLNYVFYLTLAGLGGSVGCAVRLETRRSKVRPPTR